MRIEHYQGTASSATAVGMVAPQQPQAGLHEGLSNMIGRLIQANISLDHTLQRIHGLRPVANEASAKNPETPCVAQLCGYLDQQITTLESYVADISKFIG